MRKIKVKAEIELDVIVWSDEQVILEKTNYEIGEFCVSQLQDKIYNYDELELNDFIEKYDCHRHDNAIETKGIKIKNLKTEKELEEDFINKLKK